MKNQAIHDMHRKFNPKRFYMVLGNNSSICIDSFIHMGFKVRNLITRANKNLACEPTISSRNIRIHY
jgi:hypothetical protein